MSKDLNKLFIPVDELLTTDATLPVVLNDLIHTSVINEAHIKGGLSIPEDETHSATPSINPPFFQNKKILLLSFLVHALVLAAVLYMSNEHKGKLVDTLVVKNEPKALKSFIYYQPKPKPKEQIAKLKEQTAKLQPAKPLEKPITKKTLTKKRLETTSTPITKESDTPKKVVKTTQLPKTGMDYLLDLKKSINKQAMQDDFLERQQHRSASVMHGKQIPVTHSSQQLTPMQEKEKNTIRMSDNISITRLGNGYCIIERKQFAGSPVPASNSGFACGESDFDKSFKVHMKKVNDKIGKKLPN